MNMSKLKQQLLLLGMADLPINTTTTQHLHQFITSSSAHFDHVRQQRPNSTMSDLLLGFMTLHHQQAQQQWSAQHIAAIKMKAVFSHTIGDNYATNFTHQDQEYLLALTHLWLMIQGAYGIDYSYSNEQAKIQSIALISNENTASSTQINTNVESLRCEFMQSYYLGKNYNTVKFSTRIKQLFRKV